jgi:6-phosphogluconolactonase (cycloisomerase 2 family)
MLTRRKVLTALAISPAMSRLAAATGRPRKVVLYASLDREIIHYDLDVSHATLTRRGSVSLPSSVQYGWPHASRRFLYVICSDFFADANTTRHYLVALRVDSDTGELSSHGAPLQLMSRPMQVTTDLPSRHILVAYSEPSGVQVFRVNRDFTIGSEVPQPGVTDKGFYAHQVRVAPDNRHAILVTRGNDATPKKPEDPGALKIFDYDDGVLSNEFSLAPNGGFGFGPRNLEFHPTRPWAYAALERESKLFMFHVDVRGGGTTYLKDTLAEPNHLRPQQLAGTIRMHPSGRFVYVTNRAAASTDFDGQKVSAGGENDISVFSIDQQTGEPRLIEISDQHKIYPRTVDIDPSGQILAVQNTVAMKVRNGEQMSVASAGLTLARIDNDGKLTLERSYDSADYTKDNALWMRVMAL